MPSDSLNPCGNGSEIWSVSYTSLERPLCWLWEQTTLANIMPTCLTSVVTLFCKERSTCVQHWTVIKVNSPIEIVSSSRLQIIIVIIKARKKCPYEMKMLLFSLNYSSFIKENTLSNFFKCIWYLLCKYIYFDRFYRLQLRSIHRVSII